MYIGLTFTQIGKAFKHALSVSDQLITLHRQIFCCVESNPARRGLGRTRNRLVGWLEFILISGHTDTPRRTPRRSLPAVPTRLHQNDAPPPPKSRTDTSSQFRYLHNAENHSQIKGSIRCRDVLNVFKTPLSPPSPARAIPARVELRRSVKAAAAAPDFRPAPAQIRASS